MTIVSKIKERADRRPQWNKKTNAFHGAPIAGSTLRSDKQKAVGRRREKVRRAKGQTEDRRQYAVGRRRKRYRPFGYGFCVPVKHAPLLLS